MQHSFPRKTPVGQLLFHIGSLCPWRFQANAWLQLPAATKPAWRANPTEASGLVAKFGKQDKTILLPYRLSRPKASTFNALFLRVI